MGAAAQNRSKDTNSLEKTSSRTSSGQLSAADQNFVKKAAEDGLAEVELGKLATEKASSDEVKKFGRRMVDDHGKAHHQLQQFAASKGDTLPNDLNAKDKGEKDKLAKISGEQFNREYANYMVKDHSHDVAAFRQESKTAKDNDLKSLASRLCHAGRAFEAGEEPRSQGEERSAQGEKTSLRRVRVRAINNWVVNFVWGPPNFVGRRVCEPARTGWRAVPHK